ncbi:3-isopropylmalate dehydratase small subunit [Akkermansiaceae bacterium]|nr:3-isopropylmalate dehydratase small subunit [Akkermansiaceae bacterium]
MAIPAISKVSGKAVPIHGADVDTDRIIPARFLKCVTFDDLAEGLFYDERFESDGSSKSHAIDAPEHQGAKILVVGPNFGCGSSREHAPQSIKRFGYEAIIGVTYAEIFFGNSTGIGMPCVSTTLEQNKELFAAIEADPSIEFSIDLKTLILTYGDKTMPITMPEGARDALVNAKWDTIQELLNAEEEIKKVAESLPYV